MNLFFTVNGITATLDKYLIPDLAVIVLEYCQLEHVDEMNNGHRYVYTTLFGDLHGEYKFYYSTGELQYLYHYVNGKLHGEYKCYYQTGELWYSCPYISDKRHGEYKEYHQTGELTYSYHWINGVKQ